MEAGAGQCVTAEGLLSLWDPNHRYPRLTDTPAPTQTHMLLSDTPVHRSLSPEFHAHRPSKCKSLWEGITFYTYQVSAFRWELQWESNLFLYS